MLTKFIAVVFLIAAFVGLIEFIFAHNLNMWQFLGAMIAYIAIYVAVIYFAFVKWGR